MGQTHLLCEGGVGFPGSRVAGVRLFHHLVDLFEGETFGFGLESQVLALQQLDSEQDDLQLGSRQRQ